MITVKSNGKIQRFASRAWAFVVAEAIKAFGYPVEVYEETKIEYHIG